MPSERETLKISARISLQRDLIIRAVSVWPTGSGGYYGYSGMFLTGRQVSGVAIFEGAESQDSVSQDGVSQDSVYQDMQRWPASAGHRCLLDVHLLNAEIEKILCCGVVGAAVLASLGDF